ncbi:MAG: NAD-dependent epimerase/dehydratase family protein [Cyclobacteriaceae bacterium]|nr:NAD-dependent epimerase/dehydratase family protein [Cyclobacteriaceae bacterium]
MIAVTGANGLLGSFVIRKLYEANVPVVAIKRNNSDTSLLADLNTLTWRTADILDPISLQEALEGVSGVIHCAAMVSFNPRDEKKLMQVNVEGTKNVVDACHVSGVTRLLHVSSVAALGRQKNQTHISESNMWIDSPYNTMYGQSKYKAELEVFRGQEEGLKTIIINPSVILSRGNWDRSSAQLFKYVWRQRPFYSEGSFNYVDVRDVANQIHQLFFSEFEGERFISNAGSITIKDFFQKLAVLLNKKAPAIKVSKPVLKVLALAELWRSYLTGSTPLITRETARGADTHFSYSSDKIKKALRCEFQTIDQTLGWCAEFYRKQMELKN